MGAVKAAPVPIFSCSLDAREIEYLFRDVSFRLLCRHFCILSLRNNNGLVLS